MVWADSLKITFSELLRDLARYENNFKYGAITLLRAAFQQLLLSFSSPHCKPYNPYLMISLACSAFARHYTRNHIRFLFLWLLRCFTSPRIALIDYLFIN